MKSILKTLLAPQPPAKIFAEVVRPLAGKRYQVKDTQDRMMEVDSNDSWRPGDYVTITRGRIIGPAAIIEKPKVYEV